MTYYYSCMYEMELAEYMQGHCEKCSRGLAWNNKTGVCYRCRLEKRRETIMSETQVSMTAEERSHRILLDLLKQVEDGYDVDYLLCNECAEGGCDSLNCECVCHTTADEAKHIGRVALRRLQELARDSSCLTVTTPDLTVDIKQDVDVVKGSLTGVVIDFG